MHVAQKKQNVHRLKKNANKKGFAKANSFFALIWLTEGKVGRYNETYV